MLVIGPEHARIFQEAGWDRAKLLARLSELLLIPGEEIARGSDGIAEGIPVPEEAREQRFLQAKEDQTELLEEILARVAAEQARKEGRVVEVEV